MSGLKEGTILCEKKIAQQLPYHSFFNSLSLIAYFKRHVKRLEHMFKTIERSMNTRNRGVRFDTSVYTFPLFVEISS